MRAHTYRVKAVNTDRCAKPATVWHSLAQEENMKVWYGELDHTKCPSLSLSQLKHSFTLPANTQKQVQINGKFSA